MRCTAAPGVGARSYAEAGRRGSEAAAGGRCSDPRSVADERRGCPAGVVYRKSGNTWNANVDVIVGSARTGPWPRWSEHMGSGRRKIR